MTVHAPVPTAAPAWPSSARILPRFWITCPGTFRSSVTSGRNMPAPRAMPSRRPRRRRCRPRAAVPRQARSTHLLVSKCASICRSISQSEIYAREGLELDRSTLSGWVGQAASLLDPVVAGIRRHVFAAEKIHGDDTTVPVLAPGLGRTKTGRLWVYVRDDRPFCGEAPPVAAYFYSPDRGGEHPAAHMAAFTGLCSRPTWVCSDSRALYSLSPARSKP